MLDIAVLRVIWWLLMGVLFMGFALTDGFDLGTALLSPLVARNEKERGVLLEAIGPFWEGNQVWIILGAGAIFAAWPYVYAVAFSGPYFVVLLLLLTLGISRPVSIKYRSKLTSAKWRHFWDVIFFLGGLLSALIFGMLIGNILSGIPFYFDDDLRLYYTGGLLDLFHPFALFCGFTSICMLAMHGALYLTLKTEDPIRARAIQCARLAACLVILCFAGGGLWIEGFTGYHVTSTIDPYGYSNPLHKEVVSHVGAWLDNYHHYPICGFVPLLGFVGALGVLITVSFGSDRFAFICSGLSMIGIIGTVGVSMFPFILPSSTQLASSLLVWDASSTALTLLLMLVATIIFLPIILLYTSWVYRALSGKVKNEIY